MKYQTPCLVLRYASYPARLACRRQIGIIIIKHIVSVAMNHALNHSDKTNATVTAIDFPL